MRRSRVSGISRPRTSRSLITRGHGERHHDIVDADPRVDDPGGAAAFEQRLEGADRPGGQADEPGGVRAGEHLGEAAVARLQVEDEVEQLHDPVVAVTELPRAFLDPDDVILEHRRGELFPGAEVPVQGSPADPRLLRDVL